MKIFEFWAVNMTTMDIMLLGTKFYQPIVSYCVRSKHLRVIGLLDSYFILL